MISKNRIKDIHALGLKKNRDSLGLFVAEGPKIVSELLHVFTCTYIAYTQDWFSSHVSELPENIPFQDEVTNLELAKASFLQTPQQVIAIFKKPEVVSPSSKFAQKDICLALDGVQDPGNVGTILRLADWFGIEHLFCSPDTADVFSPKVVQASMGAISRVQVHKVSLPEFLETLPDDIPVYGTFLDGKDIHRSELSPNGIIVMGNEGNGIRPETEVRIKYKLFVPSYPVGRPTSESLNVAIATAITCEEFRRRAIKT